MTADWREPLLAGASLLDVRLVGRNPAGWPGYDARPALRAYRLRGAPGRQAPVALVWDFAVYGGSFGEDDATTLAAAVRMAISQRAPVISLVRSGGTRLQEGMAALVGIARARLALLSLSEAGLPHLCVADAPTTGGIWISVGAAADLRVAVEGAIVGFAGPRVVQATTGELPGPDSHTASSAHAAGLVDAVLAPEDVLAWLHRALSALTEQPVDVVDPRPAGEQQPTTGWQQILRARSRTRGGVDLVGELLSDRIELRAPHGDQTVGAALGRMAGRPVVAVALAARPRTLVTPAGFRLAARAFRLAARLDVPVLSLVDTPGADPSPASEADGLAGAIGEAMDALLTCRSPTLGLLHGEGGSGGALAASVTDVLLATPDSYFAAIGPEGAQAALRQPAEHCADAMGITPADLLALGVTAGILTDPTQLIRHLDHLLASPAEERRRQRVAHWSRPVTGIL